MRGNFTLTGTKTAPHKVEKNTSLTQVISLGTWKQLGLKALQTSGSQLPALPGISLGTSNAMCFSLWSPLILPTKIHFFSFPSNGKFISFEHKDHLQSPPTPSLQGVGVGCRKFGAALGASCPRRQFKKVFSWLAENCKANFNTFLFLVKTGRELGSFFLSLVPC